MPFHDVSMCAQVATTNMLNDGSRDKKKPSKPTRSIESDMMLVHMPFESRPS